MMDFHVPVLSIKKKHVMSVAHCCNIFELAALIELYPVSAAENTWQELVLGG